jgi:hypothetical protein
MVVHDHDRLSGRPVRHVVRRPFRARRKAELTCPTIGVVHPQVPSGWPVFKGRKTDLADCSDPIVVAFGLLCKDLGRNLVFGWRRSGFEGWTVGEYTAQIEKKYGGHNGCVLAAVRSR